MSEATSKIDEIISVVKSGHKDSWAVAYKMSLDLEGISKNHLFSSILSVIETLSSEERCDAIRCIISFDEEASVEYLNSVVLNDSSNFVRSCACWILEGFGNETSVESLYEVLLKDTDLSVKIAAIDALVFLNAKDAINPLQQVIQKSTGSKDEALQEAALEALQHLSRPLEGQK